MPLIRPSTCCLRVHSRRLQSGRKNDAYYCQYGYLLVVHTLSNPLRERTLSAILRPMSKDVAVLTPTVSPQFVAPVVDRSPY